MKGAPLTANEIQNGLDVIVRAVDQRGREIDQRWGIGRLPAIVPIDIADKFRNQHRKFSAAIWEASLDDARRHGDAMLRAYGKLEEIALSAGAQPVPPEQWEIEAPEGLIVLVRDIRDTGRVELGGRKAQIWSMDEIASVIRNHPSIAALKDAFPGAIVESVRPPVDLKQHLNDSLMEIPA